jgi:hypothetical protein
LGQKDVLNEIALLRGYASNQEANRFMNMPAVRQWLGEEATIKQRAHSCASPRPQPPSAGNTARCQEFSMESQQINGEVGRHQTYCMYQLCIANGGQIPSADYRRCP